MVDPVRTPPPDFDPERSAVDQAPAFIAAAPPRKQFPHKLELILFVLLVALFVGRLATATSPERAVAVNPIAKGKVIAEADVEAMPLFPAADFRHSSEVVGRVAKRDIAAGRPFRAADVGDASPDEPAQKALRDIQPYRILTAADLPKPPSHGVALRGVRANGMVPDAEIVELANEHDAVTVVRAIAAPPHLRPGIAALLYAKDATAPVPVQLLKALGDDRYVVACRAADAAIITATRVAIVQETR
ncbi:MAG TPA: SAF domain-containing protein [Thermoanaerobaculia bacterium]|nr:SAF domain-containing protein [Thermoanaerobaculia bacterium]